MMKKYLLYFSFCTLLILSGCGETQEEVQSGSGDIFSGMINEEVEVSTDETPSVEENTNEEVKNEEIKNEQPSENQTGDGAEVGSGEEIRQAPSQSWFGVEECNRIIDFNLCIISKAPIENQEIMKDSLRKAVEPWKLLANAQLREVCQKAIEKDTFKEVVAHYEALDNGCKY